MSSWRTGGAVRTSFLASVALLCALVLALAGLGVGPVTSRDLAPAEISHQGGHAYYVDAAPQLPAAPFLVTARPDNPSTPRSSTLVLLENGQRLGPPHSSHADVQHRGEGRFSHWSAGGNAALIFSTSDNSDPRSNARTYVLRTQWLPAPGAAWLAGIVLVATIGLLLLRLSPRLPGRATAPASAAHSGWLTESRRVRIAWIVAATALLLLVSDALRVGPAASRVVSPEEIAHQSGHSYSFVPRLVGAVPLLTIVPPSNGAAPRRSRAQLYEDGRALGPAQAEHAAIAASGMGRFSHWGDQDVAAVIFSTSDNTDPRTNGRSYAVRAPWHLKPAIVAVALLLFVAAVGYLYLHVPRLRQASRMALVDWASRPAAARFAICGIAGIAALVWIATFWGTVAISYDSGSYLTWSVAVPLGYPWLLAAVKAVTGSYIWTPVVQILLLAASIAFVCDALWRLLRLKVLAILLALALVCYTPSFRYATFILSESVYISLILINIGAALRLLDSHSRANALALAISAALVMFVRPAGYYVVLGTLFLLIAWRGMARRMALTVALPLAACIAVTALATMVVRGTSSQSLTGTIVFPTVSHLFEPSYAAPEENEIAREVYAALQPHRESLAKLSGIEARYRHARDTFNTRAADIWGVLNKHIPTAALDGTSELRKLGKALPNQLTEVHKWMNGIEFRFAQATIVNRPIGYVETVLTQAAGAWGWEVFTSWGTTPDWFASQVDALHAEAIATIQHNNLDVPLEAAAPAPQRFLSTTGRTLAIFDAGLALMLKGRDLFVGIGALAFAAIFATLAFRHRLTPQALALGYLGVLIHGAVFLIAAVTVVIPRYVLAIDPVVLVAGVLVVDMLIAAASVRLRPHGPTLRAALTRTGESGAPE